MNKKLKSESELIKTFGSNIDKLDYILKDTSVYKVKPEDIGKQCFPEDYEHLFKEPEIK